ncbi:O-antigen ligase family protein [Mucilaginibacter ginkgonis]|uniref:O-antigen ligase family protein n=1 Tax=Mucilaginibacter ginkgonis TaxID=2682091 RepID=A0A6I4IN68_9SPHI|nr:O-antigen ligase family protein [Mucilaginibacter ginkgonis]QQL51238.1 O-antigen ligase family protein [Mucilaginibacter ginkgonis]
MILTKEFNSKTWADWFYQPKGYIGLALIGLILTAAVVQFGTLAAIGVIMLVVGIPFALAVINYPAFGVITLMVAAYLVMWLNRMLLSFPAGLIMDGMEVLMIIGFVLKHKYDRTWEFLKSPISIMVLLWLTYNILEVINPVADSKMAWLFTIRSLGVVCITYFIFMYHIKTVSFIRLIIKAWLILSVFAALYTILQEYHGFLAFEKAWLATSWSNADLYFIGGRWRRFSIFSDPVAAAYNMVISTILCLSLMFAVKSVVKKVMLAVIAMLCVVALLYTGIRGAFVLLPAGLALLFILKLSKRSFVVGIICVGLFGVFLKIPIHNTAIYRVQTAFFPSYDPSFNVRKYNQKRIQPYIQSHPFGGGLGATGMWGQRFSKGSYLASFPPDSGFMRVAVEEGWIGLVLLCSFLFVILRQGIRNYFAIHDRELKSYCLAVVLIIFVLSVGNYPQEALVQFPINIYFYLFAALINITLKLDIEKREQQQKITTSYAL